MSNRMIANNFNKPVVYGVVGQGRVMKYCGDQMTNSLRVAFDYNVYRMELVAPLVYLLIKVRSFYLPRSTYDLTVALTTISALLQLQQLTYNQVYKARLGLLKANRLVGQDLL